MLMTCVCFYRSSFYSCFCFFKQKTAYEMRISDWSSDVCSSDLRHYLCRDQVAQGSGQCTPLIGWGQFKQVSDVSGVQRADEVAHFLGMSFIDMIEHSRNKFGLQPVVFVESCVVGQNVVFGLLRRIGCAGFAHSRLLCPSPDFVPFAHAAWNCNGRPTVHPVRGT